MRHCLWTPRNLGSTTSCSSPSSFAWGAVSLVVRSCYEPSILKRSKKRCVMWALISLETPPWCLSLVLGLEFLESGTCCCLLACVFMLLITPLINFLFSSNPFGYPLLPLLPTSKHNVWLDHLFPCFPSVCFQVSIWLLLKHFRFYLICFWFCLLLDPCRCLDFLFGLVRRCILKHGWWIYLST